jgi:UDP-2,3-diacylglucosamine pyrophosphatase LpxH
MNKHEADRIYLIGDIVDGWRLKKSRYWPASHDDAVQTILKKAHLGAKISYIPGNHDEFVRRYAGRRIKGVEILDQTIHTTADGRRYLVTHGDQYDVVIQNAKWLAYLGDCFYEFALSTNTWLNWVRGRMGLKYWSLGAFAKRHVKSFVNIIGNFEAVVAEEVRGQELNGVICGHIHHATSRETNGIHYVNTGDWVESCTAVVEHHDGTLEVLYWEELSQELERYSGITLDPKYDEQTS